MNRICEKILALILMTIICIFSLCFFFGTKERFSENENRYLATYPSFDFTSFFQGEYTENVTSYVSDHFPKRDRFMMLKTDVERWLGKDEVNHIFFAQDNYLIESYQKPERTKEIIEKLNQFYQKLNYTNMSLLLVPTSITINQDKLPLFAPTYSQIDTMRQIYHQLIFNSIDVTQVLSEGNKKYPMFYRMDHHWTSYGAYYAYLEFCAKNDIDPISIDQFEIKEITNDFRGTIYSKVNTYTYPPDSIHLFLPKNTHYEVNYVSTNRKTQSLYEFSYLEKKDKYSLFLDNNHPLIQITNRDILHKKELLVIKDSYANSFVPFLVNHFSKVHVIDPRFFRQSISDYVKENPNIQDVLILYNMNTIDQDTGILSIR